ncbi:helix-turn-helix domain-containing protein [Desulfoplanes sp.]
MQSFTLITPEEVAVELARRVRELRLAKKWKQKTLAQRSGVSEGSLKRFEQTGKISMSGFLKLVFTLGRLDEVSEILKPPRANSIKELQNLDRTRPKRGSV